MPNTIRLRGGYWAEEFHWRLYLRTHCALVWIFPMAMNQGHRPSGQISAKITSCRSRLSGNMNDRPSWVLSNRSKASWRSELSGQPRYILEKTHISELRSKQNTSRISCGSSTPSWRWCHWRD